MVRLALTVCAALLLAALGFFLEFLGPVVALHLAFAAGALPLILGAMLHFVPVLTRTGSPLRPVKGLPWLVQAVGVGVVLTLHGVLPRSLLLLWAVLDMLAVAVVLGWMVQRARRCLGKPHPGWRWYAAALVMLLLALVAVLLMFVWPERYPALYRWHLHLNTLGLIGLAALGTLPVLLPTVMNRPDSQAALWLQRYWLPCGAGVLLVGLGSAGFWLLAVLGGGVLAWSLGQLLWRWWQLYRQPLWQDGAALPLCGAAVLLLLLLLSAPWWHGRQVLAAFFVGFLLPLITGSLSQLLPIWRYPGPVTPARLVLRQRLTAGGQWRAIGFALGGVACLGGAVQMAAGLVLLGLLPGVFYWLRHSADSEAL